MVERLVGFVPSAQLRSTRAMSFVYECLGRWMSSERTSCCLFVNGSDPAMPGGLVSPWHI